MYGMWGRCDGGDAGTRLDVVSMDAGGASDLSKVTSSSDEGSLHTSVASTHSKAKMTQFEPMKNDLILRTARGQWHL
jgi:hypothetical protein